MWYGHVFKSSGLAKTILKGTSKEEKRRCTDNEETGIQRVDRNRLCKTGQCEKGLLPSQRSRKVMGKDKTKLD